AQASRQPSRWSKHGKRCTMNWSSFWKSRPARPASPSASCSWPTANRPSTTPTSFPKHWATASTATKSYTNLFSNSCESSAGRKLCRCSQKLSPPSSMTSWLNYLKWTLAHHSSNSTRCIRTSSTNHSSSPATITADHLCTFPVYLLWCEWRLETGDCRLGFATDLTDVYFSLL